MPVTSNKDRHARSIEFLDILVENRHNAITVLDAESTARTEIILHIYNQ